MDNVRTECTMRVIFAGGATGGHLMPGVATALALKKALPGARSLFLTSDNRTERRCSGALDAFETAYLPQAPWHGPGGKLLFPAKALHAAARMADVIRGFRPHVVVGLGSYNSAVPVLCARLAGVPTALVAADALPGVAVRLLAPVADVVLVQWGEVIPRLKARRAVVTGLPVRESILSADRRAALRRFGFTAARPTLLAMGGSQGALALNSTLHEALQMAAQRGADLQVVHLTGIDHLQTALQQRFGEGINYRPIGFLDHVEDAYAAADFAFGRAGASTLAELTAVGLPSILVPYPHAANDEQRLNAALLSEAGAAIVIPQPELSAARLCHALTALAGDAALRRSMAESALSQGRPDAACRAAQELAELAGVGPQMARNTLQMEPTTGHKSQAA
jgi:UDP-N-acetylglucosamine--N-acetylmuramyl-(pentapeptide) pyrophosphoryl-undecaprenol N-acetylglucosamine transferase